MPLADKSDWAPEVSSVRSWADGIDPLATSWKQKFAKRRYVMSKFVCSVPLRGTAVSAGSE